MPEDPYLDPDAPDIMGDIPDHHLTAEGFAYRLLRFIIEAQHDGIEPRLVLLSIEHRCRGLVERTAPPPPRDDS